MPPSRSRRCRRRHCCWSRRSCPEPIATAEAIAAALRELLQHLTRRLGEEGSARAALSLAAYRIDGRIERIAIGTAFPSRDTRHLWRLFEERLEQIDPGLGIEDLVLTAESVEKLAAAQLGLDGEAARSDSADLAALVDRLANRLGMRALARPVLRESHIPERAVRFVRAARRAANAGALECRASSVRSGSCRGPSRSRRWRRSPMIRRCSSAGASVRIACAMPMGRSASRRMVAPGFEDRFRPSAPESRDYYRVEDEEGQRFWLYRAGLYRPDSRAALVPARLLRLKWRAATETALISPPWTWVYASPPPVPDALRQAVRDAYRMDESAAVARILAAAEHDAATTARIAATARRLVLEARRQRHGKGGIDVFLNEFALSSREGIALMCLAEALLRIPDADDRRPPDPRQARRRRLGAASRPFVVALRQRLDLGADADRPLAA